MTPKSLIIAATLVASTIGLGLVGYRLHQQSPAEVCKRTSHQLLKLAGSAAFRSLPTALGRNRPLS